LLIEPGAGFLDRVAVGDAVNQQRHVRSSMASG
jgi:hypothetical protein